MSYPIHPSYGSPSDADDAPTADTDRGWATDVDVDDPDRESTSTVSVFEGDEGGLEVDQRRALVALIKQRFISGRTHPKEWKALTRNPRPIRARLNDVFLDLHIDTTREVAFKRQVAPEGGGRPFPTLLYDAPWGREDTILLVFLRSRFRSEQAAGANKVYIDRQDMLEFIEQHRPPHATDQSSDGKRAIKAIDTVYKAGLLVGPSTGERFEVSNAIEILLTMDTLVELLTWLRTQNGSPAADGTGDDTSTADQTADQMADEPVAAAALSYVREG